MPKIVVINNSARVIWGQLPHTYLGKGNIQQGGVVTVKPGVNLIDAGQLAELKKSTPFSRLFADKIVASAAPEHDAHRVGKPYLELGAGGKELPDEAPCGKLPPAECDTLIAETEDVALLQAWYAYDQRESVRKTLHNRLEFLRTAPLSSAAAAGMR